MAIFQNVTLKIETSFKLPQGRKSPGGGGARGVSTQLFGYYIFLLLTIIKRIWRIYSLKNLDSVSLAQIVFEYDKQNIA